MVTLAKAGNTVNLQSAPMTTSTPSAAPRIVADIGGTNGRFAIVRDGRVTERREYRNAEFADLAALFRQYLTDAGTADDDVEAACLAVAAPISTDGVAKFTNAPWRVSVQGLKDAMGFTRVALINDFAAQAYGLESLDDDAAERIAGVARDDAESVPRVILGPGTGLGCAALVPAIDDEAGLVAVTSEGGHMGYAAETDDDRRILDHAREKFGRVSWERVCCGAGLALVHEALWPDDRLKGVADGDPSEVVRLAQADRDSRAGRTVAQYSGMLGSFAGDLALVFRGEGGVYLTGGVLGHLGPAFDVAAFLRRFLDKGRYRQWLADVGVYRITADDVALRGCARYLERTA